MRTVITLVVILFSSLNFESWVYGKISNLNQQMAMQSTLPIASIFDNTVCRTIPGFTKFQQELCFKQPDVTVAALQGLQEAMSECQHQFQTHRWNCSTLANKQNPYTSSILKKGYRETAFAYALSAAGVTISVAKACSQERLVNCGCDHRPYRVKGASKSPWKWGGCSHNLQYGIRFSKMLLDNKDRASDLHSKIIVHNNQVGRMAVSNNMQIKCKCHGMSGSCGLKTCWRSAPDIRHVGRLLKERYRGAILVDQSNLGSDSTQTFNVVKQARKRRLKSSSKFKEWTIRNKNKKKTNLAYDLLYYQRSPNFCERDNNLDVSGTMGRQCNRNNTGSDSCGSLCCGRGYNLVRRRRTERCNCKFMWCCTVECQTCTVEEWITVCK
ncbi:PREDICTED: protein Wnt-10b [Nicrophorus vespilloides]|uniref:Protein Wnt n=1 Tax=Nicrophorus vespilloides TaxID=110193 RepID=A0ABM1MTM0_NICVS|nr:PREDICTED: protein Wnt-10b [Nicrophorus vespilloides]